jgi:hypothetical protein
VAGRPGQNSQLARAPELAPRVSIRSRQVASAIQALDLARARALSWRSSFHPFRCNSLREPCRLCARGALACFLGGRGGEATLPHLAVGRKWPDCTAHGRARRRLRPLCAVRSMLMAHSAQRTALVAVAILAVCKRCRTLFAKSQRGVHSARSVRAVRPRRSCRMLPLQASSCRRPILARQSCRFFFARCVCRFGFSRAAIF